MNCSLSLYNYTSSVFAQGKQSAVSHPMCTISQAVSLRITWILVKFSSPAAVNCQNVAIIDCSSHIGFLLSCSHHSLLLATSLFTFIIAKLSKIESLLEKIVRKAEKPALRKSKEGSI